MRPDIKFCGLTRRIDVEMAESLGAAYLGVIFAPSARQVTLQQASLALGAKRDGGPRRVGVFAGSSGDDIVRALDFLWLDVAQLHGVGDASLMEELRRRTNVQLWNVLHVGREGLAAAIEKANDFVGDAILLDAKVDGMLGGTGTAFDWRDARNAIERLRARGPIILAGGLRPENVSHAVALLAPDVVDVSSGVELSPGIKDHSRMRAFVHAVNAIQGAPNT
ncbi:MAG: phosphoribosylanthranilate isomerase [Gemmatimonadaceae bacterium]